MQGQSAVDQNRVRQIREAFLDNARIPQLGTRSNPELFNLGFGHVNMTTPYANDITFLASSSKVLILLELAQGLNSTGQRSVPLTQQMIDEVKDRNPARLKSHPDIYRGSEISISELFYQVATLSSNSATTVAKNLRGSQVGVKELEAAYQQLAPSYRMLQTLDYNHHWSEYRPNTGRIAEIAYQMDALIKRVYQGQATELEIVLSESLLNNPQSFDFCFTHSRTGRRLRKFGWRIYEKTGYYPGYTWGIGLAELGYPIVLTESTVFTLVSPLSDFVATFWGFANWEMPMPWETITEYGVTFPNEWGKEFKQLVGKRKPRIDLHFRAGIEADVNQYLSL